MSFIDKLNRFASNPVNMNMKRSKLNLSHGHKMTAVAGQLFPIMCDEVLPDDTIKINLSSVVRSITPAVPVMDNAYLDVFAFWVPARLCTVHEKDWQKIHGENTNGFWTPPTESTLVNTGNTFTLDSSHAVLTGSIGNNMGLPIGFYHNTMNLSRLPFNGFALIWNEWFRDQNTQAPEDFRSWTNSNVSSFVAHYLGKSINKYHDYFTSALPSPQKGVSVLLPMAGSAPVKTSSTHIDVTGSQAMRLKNINNNGTTTAPIGVSSGDVFASNSSFTPYSYGLAPSNLIADLTNATAVSVNEMRQAFAIQKLFEKDARGGTRYREVLMTHFGVSIPDNTVQVPEYLGGKRIPLNQLQVLQTVSDSNGPLGSTGAFSNTSDSSDLFVKSFAEYGYVYIVGCIRNNQSYAQGISKMFTRNRRFDWYYPVFANLGEQAIKETEIYADNSSNLDEVFGYQEAWAEYRFKPNLVTGYLAPGSGDTIAQQWTYVNQFTAKPVLNSSFMSQDRSQIDNTLVVKNASYQFICDFWINYTSWRAMPLYSIPGLIDHH